MKRAALGALLVTLLALALLALFLLPLWLVPKTPSQRMVAEATLREELRRSLAAFLTLATVAITAYVAIRQLGVAGQNQGLDRYQRALEVLGNERASLRAGAVEALAQLAHEDKRYTVAATTVMLSHVRSTAHPRDRTKWLDADRPDLQLAVEALAHLTATVASRRQFLRNLSGVDLTKSLFERVTFRSLNLEVAVLENAVFRDCRFIACNLVDSQLVDADFARCSFRKSDLSTAMMDRSVFTECRFRRSTVFGVSVRGTVFRKCSFVKAHIVNTDLAEAQVDSCRGLG